MIRFSFAVEIERPVAEVWAYLIDPSHLPEWQSSCTAARRLDDGPMAAGATIDDERRFMGRHVRSTVEVTEFEPERLFSLKGTSGPIPFEVRHSLEADDGRTRLTVEARGEPHGVSRFAAPIAARAAEHEFKRDFERLKARLESA